MARRKDHTREELTALATKCGQQLVVAEGSSALTARNVAKMMGYTAGTLYNIFENIDGLAAAINIQSMDSFAEGIEEILRHNAKPKKRLRLISKAYLTFQEEEPYLWALLFATPINSDSDAYRQAVHRIFDQVAEALQPLSGSAKAARQDAKILWSTLHGICLLKEHGKLDVSTTDTPEELVKRFLDQFLQK
ncbi:MAG: TetR/AcrR family transcriptional regulator [Opitutaceae bacterium]